MNWTALHKIALPALPSATIECHYQPLHGGADLKPRLLCGRQNNRGRHTHLPVGCGEPAEVDSQRRDAMTTHPPVAKHPYSDRWRCMRPQAGATNVAAAGTLGTLGTWGTSFRRPRPVFGRESKLNNRRIPRQGWRLRALRKVPRVPQVPLARRDPVFLKQSSQLRPFCGGNHIAAVAFFRFQAQLSPHDAPDPERCELSTTR